MASTLQEAADESLLAACRADNIKAYDVLFERYASRLYQYALKYLKDEAVAEETMMDIMLWVWEKRHQLGPEIVFAPYVFRAVKNAVLKVITRKSNSTIPLEAIDHTYASQAYQADNHIYNNELQAVYQEQLDTLSQQRQKVFLLSRHEQMSHAEIAKEMNLSLFTVKNHIKASLSHFRRQLKDYVDVTLLLVVFYSLA